MESHTNSVEDKLIRALDFQLDQSASYVTDRKSTTFYPVTGNTYGVTGVRVMKFNITGDMILDPSTFRVMFDVVNKNSGTKPLRTLSGPWSFFRRCRILIGGTTVEDIDMYNAVHEMFHILTMKHSRENDEIEGFGYQYNIERMREYPGSPGIFTTQDYQGIPSGGGKKTVMFKPLLGLLNQDKYIPLRYAPMQLELEIVSNASDPVIFPSSSPDTLPTLTFQTNNCSNEWEINQCQVKVDLITVSNQFENELAKHLLSGGSLPIAYDTYISQTQAIVSSNHLATVTRSISKLKSIFMFLTGPLGDYSFTNKAGATANLSDNELCMVKDWNSFYHPSGHFSLFDSRDEIEWYIQIGSKKFPETEVKSVAESFYQLRKTLGHTSLNSVDISPYEYRAHKFICAIDTEKVIEASWTGLNTKSGDLLTVNIKQNTIAEAEQAIRLNLVLHSSNILEIRDIGVTVLD